MSSPLAPRRAGSAARRSFLLLPPALAAGASSCARRPEPPPPPLAPMSWSHLTPLPLEVAALEVAPAAPPAPPGDVGASLSPTPAEAVRGMARDRLSALGGADRAVFLVTAASLVRERGGGGGLRCALGCRLEILGAAGVEEPLGFMEAAATRGVSGPDAARPRAADLLLRRAMDDLNVEFEFQLRRNLRRWLASAAPAGGAVPAPVGREELPPRAGGGAAPEPEPPSDPPQPEE